jgi:hypothetical protein
MHAPAELEVIAGPPRLEARRSPLAPLTYFAAFAAPVARPSDVVNVRARRPGGTRALAHRFELALGETCFVKSYGVSYVARLVADDADPELLIGLRFTRTRSRRR